MEQTKKRRAEVLRTRQKIGTRNIWTIIGRENCTNWEAEILILTYLLTETGLTPGGSSTVHIYTQTIHRTTQSTQAIHRTTQLTNWEECGPCPVFASYALAFALQLRKKHGKTCQCKKPSVRVAEECQLAR